ncbi:hypothetical protein M378DRAFT_807627 [Amanita muscaria Koide BX008]|uniref:Uncharacterized protein n=1 Tax=Amanita muscaria (strain Koide BX008) TaxID=946122 RepID=A0A0C2WKI3_AMAMK|nr:hypothetical protein M378DRAFT_807627 [Amanita muscaria Koide BX008]
MPHVQDIHAMTRSAPEASRDVLTNPAYTQALLAHLVLQNQSLMAQIPQNVSKVKSEEKLIFNNTAPQVPTVVNNSAADILNNRRTFFASLLPHTAAADNQYKELDCNEYDQVKFWDQDTFNKWFRDFGKTGGPTPRGQLSKKLYFLEDEEGELIGQNEISAMRRALKRIFSMVKEHIPDMAKKWLQMSTEFHEMVYIELRLLFPQYLSLCKNNWKACEFAKNCIRNWSRNRSKKGKTGSDDECESDIGPGNHEDHHDRASRSIAIAVSSSKRRLEEENLNSASAAKKAKVATANLPVKDPL